MRILDTDQLVNEAFMSLGGEQTSFQKTWTRVVTGIRGDRELLNDQLGVFLPLREHVYRELEFPFMDHPDE